MTVPFNTIPNTIRCPLFYAEMDNSKAGTFSATYRTLILGQVLSNSSAVVNEPVYISSKETAKNKFGQGSQLAQMVESYLKNNSSVEVYCLPIADPASGTAAAGAFTISGTATEAGVLSLYVYDTVVQVGIGEGDTADQIATAAAAVINANADLPVTAAASEGSVTVTAKNKGICGNDIILSVNLLGETNGEKTPAGVTIGTTQPTGGAGNVTLATAISNLGEEQYDFIISAFTDATSLTALREYMNDATGAWSYSKQLYGHVWGAYRGTVSAAQTLGAGLNDQHLSILPINGTNTPIWCVAAALAGASATSIAADPARPLQTLQLNGVSAPSRTNRFTLTERETLLKNGMSTYTVVNGVVQIERVITTYQKNGYGQADNSYLSVETLYTSAYVLRYLRSIITSKYGRHKLADDGTKFGEGQAIATPKIIKAELIAAYQALENLGLVENEEDFKAGLIVERNINDRNRLDVLFDPDYVNQLNVFALLNQFRL
ncbi:MAG: phage tail sheath subtilisin-like domain-containing protein [Alphaproteobacteria bacterium]|nr:phage tail sheath subtilisin-like domain-containing protein [Alphaproteobacteria bacterium]